VEDHTLILYTIVGWSGSIGKWSRIEGTPSDPNPNKPFAKMENVPLFNEEGRLNPSITVLGKSPILILLETKIDTSNHSLILFGLFLQAVTFVCLRKLLY